MANDQHTKNEATDNPANKSLRQKTCSSYSLCFCCVLCGCCAFSVVGTFLPPQQTSKQTASWASHAISARSFNTIAHKKTPPNKFQTNTKQQKMHNSNFPATKRSQNFLQSTKSLPNHRPSIQKSQLPKNRKKKNPPLTPMKSHRELRCCVSEKNTSNKKIHRPSFRHTRIMSSLRSSKSIRRYWA